MHAPVFDPDAIVVAWRRAAAAPAAGELGLRLAQAGARRKALRGMPTLAYSAGLLPLQATGGGDGPVCAICLTELEPEERVRVLPECNHGFHVRCVDRWLVARFTCPTCRESLFAAPQKGFGCADTVPASVSSRRCGRSSCRSGRKVSSRHTIFRLR